MPMYLNCKADKDLEVGQADSSPLVLSGQNRDTVCVLLLCCCCDRCEAPLGCDCVPQHA